MNTVVHVHVFQSQAVPTSVFDRLQYGNTEGEDLGDLVTWVTSDRWRVKIHRVVPNEGSSNTFCVVHLNAGGQSVSRAASIPIVVCDAGDGLT